MNGIPGRAPRAAAAPSSYVYDTANAQEVGVTVGGGIGESDIGGPSMNIVPKSGGNQFKGSAFINSAGTLVERQQPDAATLQALNPNLKSVARHHEVVGLRAAPTADRS